MYVDLLSSALDAWVDELTGVPLLEYARVCRETLTHPGAYGVLRSSDLLAAELSYDRALVRLCSLHAISVDPRAFVFPAEARARLESALAAAGVSLDVVAPADAGKSGKAVKAVKAADGVEQPEAGRPT